MSRAFVKESDDAGSDLPDRPQSLHPNYVTPAGLRMLQQAVDALESERRPLAGKKDDPIKGQRLGIIDRDLRYFHGRIEHAILVDITIQQDDRVLFGATVGVEDENGNALEFTIVGEDEADVARNKVSWVSPLANALIGASIGDSVKWHRPAGDMELEISSIKYIQESI